MSVFTDLHWTEESIRPTSIPSIIQQYFERHALNKGVLSLRKSLEITEHLPPFFTVYSQSSPHAIICNGEQPRSQWLAVDSSKHGYITRRTAILPGSFNPLHVGHLALLKAAAGKASTITGDIRTGILELSIVNPDKPSLNVAEVLRRLEIGQRVIVDEKRKNPSCVLVPTFAVSNTPLFPEKSSLFHNSVLIMGTDTAARLFRTEYYGGSLERMETAIRTMVHDNNCWILVGGRREDAGKGEGHSKFQTLDDLQAIIPDAVRPKFIGLSPDEFRVDISSSRLREKQKIEQSQNVFGVFTSTKK